MTEPVELEYFTAPQPPPADAISHLLPEDAWEAVVARRNEILDERYSDKASS
jgi:hypothetical protein